MTRLFLLILLTSQYLFALISIEPVEIGQKAGVHGELAISLETKRGNTQRDDYTANTRITYDNNSSFVTWGEISSEYGKSNGVEDTKQTFLHLRHIHAITKERIRGELFAQLEEDKFKLIKRRLLAGAGVRIKLFDILDAGDGYLGLGSFYEGVNYTSDSDPTEQNLRFNTYFAYTLELSEDSKLSCTLYYQPKYDELKEYVNTNKLNLELRIYKELFLNLRVSYDTDAQPAIGIKKYDFYQQTALVYKF